MSGTLLNVGDANLLSFGPIAIEYGPKGTTCHFDVTCPTIAPLINYYNYIVTFGASGRFMGCDVGVDGKTGAFEKRLSVSVPGLINNLGNVLSELYFDQWELLTNENSDSIFANPIIVGTFGPGGGISAPILNYNDKIVLSRLARDGGTLAQAISNCNADVTAGLLIAPTVGTGPFGGGVENSDSTAVIFQEPGVSSPLDGYGGSAPKQLAKEIQKGQFDYYSPAYVLRHTSFCSAQSTYNTGIENTEEIYTPAQLLTEVGSGWTYNLPPRLYTKIATIPFQYAAWEEQPYYAWGWLKKITHEPVLENFIVEVSTEYVLALWSTIRYKIAS